MLIRAQYKKRHDNIRWICSFVIFIIFVTDAIGDLLLKPENSWAKDGYAKNVILKCNSTFGYRLNWLIKTSGSSEKLPIFNGYRVSKNVISYCKVINGSPGKYDLSLTATTNAAQQYVCLEPGTMMEASAELIIIETDPECNVTTDGELTTLTCHIRFHGNWAPVMEWTMGNSSGIISEGVNTTRGGESLTSRVVVPVNISRIVKMDYTCTTKFTKQEKPSDTTAENIPSYIHIWNSTEYIAEYHKGTGDDGAKEENEAMVGKEKNIKREATATSMIVSVTFLSLALVAGLIVGLVAYRRRKILKKKEYISTEEVIRII